MSKRIDLTGKRFGRLTVINCIGVIKKRTYWLCKCDCGIEKTIMYSNLREGCIHPTRSCGCLNDEKRKTVHLKHGLSHSKITRAYQHLKARCENPNDFRYPEYGARGIKCFWSTTLDFVQDMKESFDEHIKLYGIKDTTIDRIDVNGNYCKENCRWATWKEQQNNRRSNRLITISGKTKNLTQWRNELGIKRSTINTRLYKKHLTPEEALKK